MRTGRILVIARAEAVRLTLAGLLESAAYEVESVATGADALAVMQAAEFDLLLADARLDDIDTRSILAEARRRWPDYAGLLLLDSGSIEGAIAALDDYAAYDYLVKPCIPVEVLAKVARALERIQLTREAAIFSRQLQASIDTARELYSTLDARLLEAMASLEDRDQRMIRFCEELSTPLATIASLAEQLQDRLAAGPGLEAAPGARRQAPDLRRWSAQIQAEAAHLAQLVATTLDRARHDLPEAQRMGLDLVELRDSHQEHSSTG